MPVQSPPTKKSSIVHRSESLRSEVSDASQQSKRVSFNRDVHVKRIPRGSAVVDRNGKLVAVLDGALKNSESSTASPSGRLWVNSLASSKEALPEEDLLREAETILKHVDSVTCSTSGHDTRSLERPSKTNGINGASSGGVGKTKPVIKSLQKSPSRLSDFFTRTLPSQIKSKSQSPPLTKSTQNLTSGTRDANGSSKPKETLKLRRSVSSDLSITNLNGSISKSEPNLYNGNRYKKVAKIKKPHGNRVALNSIGETPTNSSSGSGSGSDKDSFPKKVSTSDSPVSSLSGPEEPSMANSLPQDYPRVSSIVQQLSSRRGKESPERNNPFANAPIVAPAGGNTHNNNQPFSYISGIKNSGNSTSSSTERGRSPSKTTPSGKLLTSPKEVIYAQVVVSGKPGEPGVPGEKRTVHTTVMNGTPSRSSPQRTTYLNNSSNTNKKTNSNSELNDTSSPNSIQHFVYDKDSDKSRTANKMNDHTSFRKGYRSTYDDFDFSSAKPRNNVTTVLLNNVDDDNLSFGSSRNNYYSGYRNQPSPSPSPNFRKPEQTFYFGNPKNDSHAISNNDFSSSYNYRSPRSNDYPSSREVSPVNKSFSSTYLVRDADRKKDSIVSSAKLVSAFGNNAHTGYDYMNNKLDNNRRESPRESPRRSPAKVSYNSGPDLPSTTRYGTDSTRYDRSSYDKNKKIKIVGSKTSTPNASNTSVNKIGLRSKENSPAPSPARDYRKSASPGKTTTLRREENSLERKYNKKNKDEQIVTPAPAPAPAKPTTTSNGGGLISTLMRRNKDKKAQKETKEKKEEKTELVNSEPDNVKENKIKRQRAKFLSAFLDKNFSKKNNPAPAATTKPDGKNTKPTDSEIEEAERRRDGEYQSWSSGDDEYRFGHHRNGQLTRGKSYNFGDLNEESASKPWYDQNDSDYRREMATSRYNSATLGRPGMRSSSHDSDMLRSKSLDRRAYRNRSPPRIIVTPNTPAVDETDKWKNTYDPIIRTFDRDRVTANQHSTLNKKVSGLSKSSYDLDEQHPEDRQHPPGGANPSSGKLRYFGDTDAEDLNYHNSNSYLGKNYSGNSNSNRFIPRTSSYLSRGKDNYSKYYTVPGSSLNSSGSENGSRMSKGSSNAGSQRSVYLHAPAVADIPPTGLQRRTLSRDELSNYSGPQKQTRHLARSMSVLAPWRPRHYREKYELNYNNADTKENQPYGRPPKPPRRVILPTRKSMSPSPGRAGSTESLLKLSEDKKGKNTVRNSTLGRNKENVNISRSKSMPKDTRFAGWLRRRRFGKEAKEAKA
ncbi:unnamed protein product [Allacma fusca]|uniref:Uncharacterized protein n=1 Tax=Allacma fusca TaxID=39272 RepID=A0A8J2LM89_9HEXA|nr:unnamed protein product [Allacma fusca]